MHTHGSKNDPDVLTSPPDLQNPALSAGDPAQVILVGHSRGSIACDHIGLHNDEIARLWRAMIPFSHYDDGRSDWGMTSAEQDRAPQRLRRLGSIPQFICGEHRLPQEWRPGKLQEMVKAGQWLMA